jgi:hypothetical protein
VEDLGSKVSYLVARRGIPVYSSDEVKLGTVVEVLDAPEADLFDGIIFDTTANRPGGHKFVDAPEVEGIYENGVVLTIDAAEAAKLAKPGKNPGSLEVSPDDVAGEPEPSFWRRAWNLLSGKG